MLVTTSYDPSPELETKAKQLAAATGGRWVERRDYSMPQLRRKFGADSVLLVTKGQIRYYVEEQPPMYFHPSMGAVRVKRLLRGEPDLLMQVSGASAGDVVLDCTAGLASDSIVFSHAVGVEGSVTALESSAVLAYLVQDGLQTYESDIPALNAAMKRITIKHADHLSYLRGLGDRSVDIVYFDPMFRKPVEESSSISPLRTVANPDALTAEAIEEARRVARKSIVLKEGKESREFERLGFEMVSRSGPKITYGVIRP